MRVEAGSANRPARNVVKTNWRRSLLSVLIFAGVSRTSPAAGSTILVAIALCLPLFASAASSGTPTSQPGGPGQPSSPTTPPPSTPGPSTPGNTTGDAGTPGTGGTNTIVISIGSVGSIDGLGIGICFGEDVEAVTATTPTNYRINGGAVAVTNVTLRPDGRSVVLHVAAPLRGLFTVAASGLLDLAGGHLTLPTVTNVAVGLTTQNVGSPGRLGSAFTCNNEMLEIIGGGLGDTGTGDQFYQAGKWVGGDFDVRVRLLNLAGTDPARCASLYARASTNADARGLSVSINPPPPAENRLQMTLRPATGGPIELVADYASPAGAKAWLRLERVGDTFTSYLSANGADWVPIAQTNQAFGPAMFVGLGVSAHNNSLLATGTFSNFRIRSGVAFDAPSCSVTQGFVLSFNTEYGVAYRVQFASSFHDPFWQTLTTFMGDGLRRSITNSAPTDAARFYRVVLP